MVLPFIFGSAVISYAFKQGDAGTLYFFDLVGAALGIVFYVLLLPLWRVEGNLLFLTFLMVLGAFIYLYHRVWLRWVLVAVQVIFLTLLFLNYETHALSKLNKRTKDLVDEQKVR